MDVDEIVAALSPMERTIVPKLVDGESVRDIAESAGMQEVEAMRACQYLSNKGVLLLEAEEYFTYELSDEGKQAEANGLPEQRFLAALDAPKNLNQIREEAKLVGNETNAAIGVLKRSGAIQMGGEIQKIKDVDFSEKHMALKLAAENQVHDADPEYIEELVQRGLVVKTSRSKHIVSLTGVGRKLVTADLSGDFVERLTQDMLKSGAWKDAKFRTYDVTSPVPSIFYGRQHYVQDAIEYIKQLWIEMGFTEMEGTYAQTAFWDLDALFVPQDHPAREMQDTFYLPNKGELPAWWEDVKITHETGGQTGSTGWQTPYSEDEARKVLLRTHTTVLSAQMLKKLDLEKDLPAKFFSVAKVFRNETLDWKHLFEFHQVEGIVVGEGLSLQDLIGLQKQFYAKMGFTDVRFRPGYFPYTEPSCEVEVYHPVKKQWIELGGMGVFRPEVVVPLLGKDIPVLAWGLGMERIITDFYGITDLRDIYTRDLSKLRSMKKFLMEDE